GRYRLVGLPWEQGHRLPLLPGRTQPYLPAARTSKAAPGLGPVTMDFTLKRGALIRGRVTDKESGRPGPRLGRCRGFSGNPPPTEAPGFPGSDHVETRTAADGSFTLVGLPGRGLLAVKAADRQDGRYVMSVGADQIKGPRFGRDHFNTEPAPCNTREFNTFA